MRMVEGYLGTEAFRTGVNAYLAAHQYGNATSADFWTAVAQTSRRPVDRIMPTFVNQPGVPLVEVSLHVPGTRRLAWACASNGSGRRRDDRPLAASEPWQIPHRGEDAGGASATSSL